MTDGRRFRILTVVDNCTRECLALAADISISGRRVARANSTRSCAAVTARSADPAVYECTRLTRSYRFSSISRARRPRQSMPVTSDTILMPPRPSALASVAANNRRPARQGEAIGKQNAAKAFNVTPDKP